ncbi:MAG: RNA 2',3'-cyclic phosphodiesterase [Pirellulales bacterium]
MQTIRTFVAVEVDRIVRRRAGELVERLAQLTDDVRWVEPQNMHFTIKFLGNVRARDTVDVCEAVESAVIDLRPFELVVEGLGAFPALERPRTIWIGTSTGSEALGEVFQRVDDAVVELGYRPEPRRFTAHMTIGRVRRHRGSTAWRTNSRNSRTRPSAARGSTA